ncbi:MAG: hypothetical protein ACRDIL_01155 [Candidatus Limnocylindrales bacterium]
MTDLVLARKLAEALILAAEIRESGHRKGVLIVGKLTDCLDHVAPELDASRRNYDDVLAEIEALAEIEGS